MNHEKYIFLDIDGVLALDRQFDTNPKKWNKEYNRYTFDVKCVKVLNEIISITNPIIILSSDWKNHYTIEQMNRIFEINNINSKIHDFTSSFWGVKFKNYKELENCRAFEILDYITNHNIFNYVAVDDLNLIKWIPDNFIHTPHSKQGIKQLNIKEKIISKLNSK